MPSADSSSSVERSLRVGVDATSWTNNRGFGRFTRELVRALAARDGGLRYTLLFDRVPASGLPAGVEVSSAGTRRTLDEAAVGDRSRSPADLWRMGRAARRGGFDVFFFPTVYSYFPIPWRQPCVVCFHDTTAERMPELLFPTRRNRRLWQLKTALARRQADRAMTASRASARDLERLLGFPRDRIDLVTAAADPVFRPLDDPAAGAVARRTHGIPREAALLVYVGGFNRHKNLVGLLAAMEDVVAARPEAWLAIVGDSSGTGFWDNLPELRAYVEARPPLAERVRFTGYLEDRELVELLNGCDALVLPSLWEGFGLPAVEAMSCGVPVLASHRGSLPEVVGEAGLFFDPDRPQAIAAAILRFLDDPKLASRLAAAARRSVRRFTWERAAELAERSLRRCHAEAAAR